MISLLYRWLKKRRLNTSEAIANNEKAVPDQFTAHFNDNANPYFQPIQEARYAATVKADGFELQLLRRNLFAWSEAPALTSGDFYMQSEISADTSQPQAPHTHDSPVNSWGVGFAFHMAAADSFMYLLVASSGAIRLERVFNGEPTTITAWTECPWVDTRQPIKLKLIARGNHYVALLNDQLALEADDDSIGFGHWAFAGQNYDVCDQVCCRLLSFSLTVNPMQIEQAYIKLTKKQDFAPDQRRRLAASAMALRQWPVAWQQLSKLQSREALGAEDHFLLAECYLQSQLLSDSEKHLKLCLQLDPEHQSAREELYNLLYLQNRFEELRKSLDESPNLAGNPRQLNLLGHALTNQGNHAGAAAAYARAAALEGGMPIYNLNAARAYSKAALPDEAAVHWLSAGRGFLAQASIEDAAECIEQLKSLGYDKTELIAMESRLAWLSADYDTVECLLAPLVRKNKADANSCYLYGLLQGSRQQRSEAVKSFKKALDLDEHNPAFLFKYAESLHLAGLDCQAAVETALSRCPNDGWIRNLAGSLALERGQTSVAIEHFRAARQALPSEPAPAINLASALAAQNSAADALKELESFRDADTANCRGNILARTGRLPEAVEQYRFAIEQADPAEPQKLHDYYTNLGACYIELQAWADAAEALRKALERDTSYDALMLMGDVWQETGEYIRAETAWQTALEMSPASAGLLQRLGNSYCRRGKYEAAARMQEALSRLDEPAGAELARRISQATEEKLECSACRLQWTVPKQLPPVARLQLRGELPDHSPAGSCPTCGLVLCVACGKQHLVDKRFVCPQCSSRLNLNDDRLRYVVMHIIKPKTADSQG